jgi:ABC-type polysaccharide/polyol phosphate transport system ATPase subunit
MTPGIAFRNVWKKFHRGQVHDSLRDLIPALTRRALGRGPRSDDLAEGDFWALRDVSFEVGPGQTLGIIGPNGAGKSTALKTITRILRPTRGSCEARGRLGALIEVAAGFHPDLTGRENVFLQGAIMGMRSAEIRKRFDEIVEFSGIADFIDTPVKRYSSGMNARLGFSIAAHLDPDVLIIDEVLSVGDYMFQGRAFDRISRLARSGIPVVVVSHQLDRIAELCTEAMLLQKGQVVKRGSPADVIGAYVLGENLQTGAGDCPVRLDTCTLLDEGPIRSGERIRVRITGTVLRPLTDPLEPLGLRIRALHNAETVFATSNTRCDIELPPTGPFAVEVGLQLNVPEGNYVLETNVWDPIRHREAAHGPMIRLPVQPGASFYGNVQMNATMALEAPTTSTTTR